MSIKAEQKLVTSSITTEGLDCENNQINTPAAPLPQQPTFPPLWRFTYRLQDTGELVPTDMTEPFTFDNNNAPPQKRFSFSPERNKTLQQSMPITPQHPQQLEIIQRQQRMIPQVQELQQQAFNPMFAYTGQGGTNVCGTQPHLFPSPNPSLQFPNDPAGPTFFGLPFPKGLGGQNPAMQLMALQKVAMDVRPHMNTRVAEKEAFIMGPPSSPLQPKPVGQLPIVSSSKITLDVTDLDAGKKPISAQAQNSNQPTRAPSPEPANYQLVTHESLTSIDKKQQEVAGAGETTKVYIDAASDLIARETNATGDSRTLKESTATATNSIVVPQKPTGNIPTSPSTFSSTQCNLPLLPLSYVHAGINITEPEPSCRYVILPGGMFARPKDIYVESLPDGAGRQDGGCLAMSLHDMLIRYDALDKHYCRLKQENSRLRTIVFEFYKKMPLVHPENCEHGKLLGESLGFDVPNTTEMLIDRESDLTVGDKQRPSRPKKFKERITTLNNGIVVKTIVPINKSDEPERLSELEETKMSVNSITEKTSDQIGRPDTKRNESISYPPQSPLDAARKLERICARTNSLRRERAAAKYCSGVKLRISNRARSYHK